MLLIKSALNVLRVSAVLFLLTLHAKSFALNNGYDLSTGDSLVLTGAAAELSNLSAFTIEFWVKTSGTLLPYNLVEFGGAGGLTSWDPLAGGDIISADLLGNTFAARSNEVTMSDDTWHHVAVVFNGGSWTYVLDGISLGSSQIDSFAPGTVPDFAFNNNNDLIFGPSSLGSIPVLGAIGNYVGSLDDIRLWNVARSVTDIDANRSLELVGNEAGLLGYWKLNETTGTVINDSAGILNGVSSGVTLAVDGAFPTNSAPELNGVDGDVISWAGVGSYIPLNDGADANIVDLDLDLLNGGLGNYGNVSLTVARENGAFTSDEFNINDTGALFTIVGNALQVGGNTFATFTNSAGQLQINFDDTLATPTTALVNDVVNRIEYRNDTPSGDALIRLSLDDGIDIGVADVDVQADVIYVTNSVDTAIIDGADGISLSESIAMVNADATGLLTVLVDSSLNADTLALDADIGLLHDVTMNFDFVPDITVDLNALNLDVGATLTIFNGTADTATLDLTIGGAGSVVKDGAGTLALTAANTYTGLTHVVDGVLELTGDLAGALTIDGDVLSNGQIDGLVTVKPTGTLEVANAPDTLIMNGGLDLQTGGVLTLQVDGVTAGTGHDQLIVDDSLTLAGDLNLIGTHVGVASDEMTLIDNVSATAVTGTFNALTEGSTVTLNSIPYVVSYNSGTGNDVSTSVLVPTVSPSNIESSGATGTAGTYKVGDTVVVEWDNSAATGDNNSDISQVTVDFSELGGGAAVSATNSADVWTASYTIANGNIDATGLNVSVTATSSQGIASTTTDTDSLTLDNQQPTVSNSNISVTGASGNASVFIVDDTIVASWDNSASGDNNGDISSVSVDFSEFGGSASTVASNTNGVWSASYTLVAGAIDSTSLNLDITATDDAGNAVVQTKTNNSADTVLPVVTNTNISTSGASGNAGEFIIGDTLVASWNDSGSVSGDNNGDTASVTVDLTEFGGGAAVVATNSGGVWSASYAITDSSTSGSALSVSVTAFDTAGNSATSASASSYEVDADAPSGHSASFDQGLYDAASSPTAVISLSDAEMGADYSYTITSANGGTSVTGGGTNIATNPVNNTVDLSGLNDGELTLTITVTDPAGNGADVTATAQLEVVAVDTDGDGISDGQEAVDSTDPNDPQDYNDTIDPTITAPVDVAIDATGLYTEVTLRQLLGLSESASDFVVDSTLQSFVSDNSNDCCNVEALELTNDTVQLEPGSYTFNWRATDGKGNSAQDTQVVKVNPLVSFSQDANGAEGQTVAVKVLLNGIAPDYPYVVAYNVNAASTSDGSDYVLSPTTSVTFTAGQTEVELDIAIQTDAVSEGSESLILDLDPAENIGSKSSLTLTIVEENLAPTMDLELSQNGNRTTVVTTDSPITINSNATDPNVGDNATLVYDWSATDSALVDTDGNLADGTFTFDPTGLPSGLYTVELTVSDSSAASDTGKLYFLVADPAPVLGTGDTDGDGINDNVEGYTDDDGDGIPNYLDNIDSTNILPAVATITDRYLLETNPGLQLKLGQYSLQGSDGGAKLIASEMTSMNDIYLYDQATATDETFDFEISDLPVAGQSVQIVLPIDPSVSNDSEVVMFINGQWFSFVENTYNQIYSAPGQPGFCPPTGDAQYQLGLTPGHHCVQLTIEDGGPNDADGSTNGSIESTATINHEEEVIPENSEGNSPDETDAGQLRFTSGGASSGGSSSIFLFILFAALWQRVRHQKG